MKAPPGVFVPTRLAPGAPPMPKSASQRAAYNAAVAAAGASTKSSLPTSSMTPTQPPDTVSVIGDQVRVHSDRYPYGVKPPARLVPSVVSALTGPPLRRVLAPSPKTQGVPSPASSFRFCRI
eukprot:4462784-Karenia_brevis.AAC.1